MCCDEIYKKKLSFFIFFLPKPHMSENEGLGDCSICLTSLLSGDDSIATTKCGHVYHYRCIIQSMEYKKACPNCCGGLRETEVYKMVNTYNMNASPRIKDDTDIVNMNKTIRKLAANVTTLAAELKKTETKNEELESEMGKSKRKSTEQTSKILTYVRDNADLWDQINSLKKEKLKLQEKITIGGYRNHIEDEGFDKVLETVLNSGEAVKNHYIKDLHKLITTANKTTAKLQEHNKQLDQRLTRYKEKYRMAADAIPTKKPPMTTNSNLSPRTRVSIEAAARRLEHKESTPSMMKIKTLFNNPESVLSQQEDRRSLTSRKRSLIIPKVISPVDSISSGGFNSQPEIKRKMSQTSFSQSSDGFGSPELFQSTSSFSSQLPSVRKAAAKNLTSLTSLASDNRSASAPECQPPRTVKPLLPQRYMRPTPTFSLPLKKPPSGSRYKISGSLCGHFTPT